MLWVLGIVLLLGCSDKSPETVVKNQDQVSESSNQVTVTSESVIEQTSLEDSSSELDFDSMEIEAIQDFVDKSMESKDWENSKKGLEYLLDDDTEVLSYHYKMGRVLFETGSYARAMDHINYSLEADGDGRDEFSESANAYLKRGMAKSKELAIKLFQLTESTSQRADLVFEIMKLDPDFDPENLDPDELDELPDGVVPKKRIYYLVSAMENYKKRLETSQTFWNYYQWGYLSFLQKWYGDARKAIEKSILFADSHALIFYALKLQEKIEEEAPSETSSDLDKLSALDLTEDMLDSFLEKYQKDLSQDQIQKARDVIKMGIKLKEKLDKASSDDEKLEVLKKFRRLSQDMTKGEDFPPDIKSKIEKGTIKAEKRLRELEEQIKVKREALKG